MSDHRNLTLDEISRLLNYNKRTGRLIWRARSPDMFKNYWTGLYWRSAELECSRWNKQFADKPLIEEQRRIRIGKYRVRTSHVIWFILYGEWPGLKEQVDHFDRDRSNERPQNLRKATNAQNSQNRGRRKDNKSGYTGVFWNKQRLKWNAELCVNGQKLSLGSFDEKEQAYEAYLIAKKKYHIFHPWACD